MTEEKIEFITINQTDTTKFKIKGKGIVLSILASHMPSILHVGDYIKVGEDKYEIRGIERALNMCDPPFYADCMGLVVKEIKENKND